MLCCIDLIAAEARYHTLCMTQFRSDRSMDKSKQVSGRPKNETLSLVFEGTCRWLEETVEIVSLKQFEDKLKEKINGDIYCRKYLKKLLKDKYSHHIFFSERPGKDTLIYFHDMANFIINDKFKEKKQEVDDEARRIIEAAANLITAEIRDMQYDTTHYPK